MQHYYGSIKDDIRLLLKTIPVSLSIMDDVTAKLKIFSGY